MVGKVLITGADGFIGSHLSEYLVRQGYNVRAFVFYNSFNSWGWLDHSDSEIKKNLDVFAGDIREAQSKTFTSWLFEETGPLDSNQRPPLGADIVSTGVSIAVVTFAGQGLVAKAVFVYPVFLVPYFYSEKELLFNGAWDCLFCACS